MEHELVSDVLPTPSDLYICVTTYSVHSFVSTMCCLISNTLRDSQSNVC